MTIKPIDMNKYGEEDKLSKDELLEELRKWRGQVKWSSASKFNEGVYRKIVALIKKLQVTEEWIEEKVIKKLKNMKGVPRGRTKKGEPYFDIISFDIEGLVRFICSLVEEIHG